MTASQAAAPIASHYAYRVTWTDEDGEYLATCVELPSLSWLAPSAEEALRGIRALAQEVVADLVADGQSVPEPFSTRQYSGKFNLRVGEDLHRRLATEAADHNLSLNQYLVRKLTAAS